MTKQNQISAAITSPENVRGRLSSAIWTPQDGFMAKASPWNTNLLQFSGADIFASLLLGTTTAIPAGMYIQFTNDVGAWAAPTVTRSGAAAYFSGLASVANQDYLRVPFQGTPALSASDPNYVGNVIDFLAMTSGVTGIHGTDFGNAFGSYVVGGAIVAVPSWADSSQDRILTRGYLGTPNEKPAAPAEVVLLWQLTCG